jgi:predicted phage baseplate assembly protein
MALQAPKLDDRTFEQIFTELRQRIPRYAPEWTDHNESDPGITLLQLFSWLTEMTHYRLNQVPERSYIKFLQLIGIELRPARPARAELTFTLARDDIREVVVPGRTQVAAADPEGGSPLVFETDEALVAIGARLAEVQAYDGFAYSLQTSANQEAEQWFYPFGANAREDSALVLGFDSPVEMTGQQLDLAVRVHTGEAADCHSCTQELAGLPPPATLVWECWNGSYWSSLGVDRDDSRAFSRDGHVLLRGPGSAAKKSSLGMVTDQQLYWLRCRLERSGYDRSPRLASVLTNTVPATQALTIRDEVLGGSDGRPGQSFLLAHKPVVERQRPYQVTAADDLQVEVRSLRLEVDEGEGFEVWQEVDDLYAATAEDRHYLLNRTTGEVRFGDGRHGRIPVANPDLPGTNIVAREYHAGGGRRGNVGAGAISQLQSYVEGVAEVSNLQPATGGSDEETVDEAKLRAPGEIKARGRAVTAEDFETLALATPGVRIRRAKAMPLCHPRYAGAAVPGTVTVVVVPDSDRTIPTPSRETLKAVCTHLNNHRLLTTEVYVVAPSFHEVVIEVDLIARPEADLAEVKQDVEAALIGYFHPLEGGADGQGWELGRAIFYSQVYRVLLGVEGIDRIKDNQLFIELDGERQESCRDVSLGSDALLYSGEHLVRVTYQLEEQ